MTVAGLTGRPTAAADPRRSLGGAAFVLVAGGVGAAVGLALSFPLPLHVRSALLEDGSYDAYQFVWNVWWVAESLLRLHVNPFYTRYLFYPDGTPLLFHTFSSSLGLASVPLQPLLGAVGAHNVLVIGAPTLTVLAVGLLAREVTEDPWAAVAAGLVAATSPVAIWFLPVLYLSCGWLIAALAWAWWRFQRTHRARDVALAVVLLAALVFASQEYAMMALALLALDTAARLLAPHALGLRRAWRAGTLAFWAVAAVGLAALARVALSDPAVPPPSWQMVLGSGYLAGLLVPPWIAPPTQRFWTILYVGTVPLVLVATALVSPIRRRRFWLLAMVALALMVLGPHLHVRNPYPDPRPPFDDLPVSGPPGPYLLALQLVPLLRFFRAVYRWIVPLDLAVAVVAGLGVAALRARVRHPPVLTAAVLLAIVAGAALDGRGLRAPLVHATVPAVYDVLRDDPEPAAVLELPSGLVAGRLAAFSSLYMFHQTAHRKFLLEGTVSRLPPGRQLVVQREITDLAALPYVKYVVLHGDLRAAAYPPGRTQFDRVAALAREAGTLVADDGATQIYRLRTFRPEAVSSAYGDGSLAPARRSTTIEVRRPSANVGPCATPQRTS